jgi:hypothetical protein
MKLLALALSVSLIPSFVYADQSVADAIKACSEKQNSLQRLVCYDGIAGRLNDLSDSVLPEARSTLSAPAVPATAVPTVTPSQRNAVKQESDFGLVSKDGEEILRAKIVKIEKDSRSLMTFTLDNGQVWRQTEVSRLRIKVGETVEIEPGRFSGYFLSSVNNNRSTNVKRIK